jgi:hypothetical protein
VFAVSDLLEDMIEPSDPDDDGEATNETLGLVVSEVVSSEEVTTLDLINRHALAGCAFFILFSEIDDDGRETFVNAAEAAAVFRLDHLPTLAEATDQKLGALDLVLRDFEGIAS